MRGADRSSTVGLQAGSGLSEREPVDESQAGAPAADRERKLVAGSAEI